MPRKRKPPSYRRREIRGKSVGYVTLFDAVTKHRRDYHLGEHGTPESRAKYARLLAEWESSGRRLPQSAPPVADGPTVSQICHAYHKAMLDRGYSDSHIITIERTIAMLRKHHGPDPAVLFGPNALRVLREAMMRPDPDDERDAWHPRTAARRCGLIVAMFRWAVAHEYLPAEAYQRLASLEPLRARTDDTGIGPAPVNAVKAARKRVSAQVAAMIDLQLLTGMRPGEACAMRPCDIDRSGKVWLYKPLSHKTAWRGKKRVVFLGPRAKEILKPYLKSRAPGKYLFSPVEAEAQRLRERHEQRETPLGQGNRPGTNRKVSPERFPGDHYTTCSYRRAIHRACDLANARAIAAALKQGVELDSGVRLVARWHPHQLRHNYATEVRRKYGLEASAILLGHGSAEITDAVYAERDLAKAAKIVAEIG